MNPTAFACKAISNLALNATEFNTGRDIPYFNSPFVSAFLIDTRELLLPRVPIFLIHYQ
jgi:hypothetical protein